VKISFPFRLRLTAFTLLLALTFPACKHSGGRVLEVAYVSGVQVNLRDRVAAVYEKAGLVKNGDRVEVLDHDRRFSKVRTASGQMGWMEQRYLVSQQVFDQLQKLTTENANDPVQAMGITRNDTNLHVEPGRETEHLYQILSGEKLAILKRGTADKNGVPSPPARPAAAAQKPPAKTSAKANDKSGTKPNAKPADIAKPADNEKPADKEKHETSLANVVPHPSGPPPVIEDWWLVRDTHGRVGWVLARMVDFDIPLDVAQYAEGQRIVAFFALNTVDDGDKKIPQYLMVLTEPKDGLPFDFNQFRVFTWNVRRHRYETAYRERLEGMLPVTLAKEDFGKEGVLPVFVIRALEQDGKLAERKYKLNTPIVRRVLAPNEVPSSPLRKEPRKASAKKRRRRR
jgi:SH3-like domain-containing protein